MEEQKSLLEAFTPKQTFIAGAVGGVLILCTIGFFILLAQVMGNGGTTGNATDVAVDAPRPTVQAPRAPQPIGNTDIQLPELTGDEWYKGGKNAKVAIVEFSDTECPFCKRFHDTMNQVMAEYDDSEVKWIYKHAPLASLHRKAQRESEATECAGELGGNKGFWAYTDRLFEITPSNDGLLDSQLPQIAEDVGLNRKKFEACLESGKYTQKVQNELREAQEAGLRGTPYSIVVSGDKKVPISGAQPYAQVKAIIDSLLDS